jgi:hypothetical protein
MYCDRSCIYGAGLETHMSYSIVVTCLMWSEILWIKMVKQAMVWLREENLWEGPVHGKDAFLFKTVWQDGIYTLMCSKWLSWNKDVVSLKQRHSPTVCLEGTHLYEYRLLVIVYGSWVISRKLMKRHGVWPISSNPRGCYVQPSISKGL